MFCTKCGKRNDEINSYCDSCRNPLFQDTPLPAAPTENPPKTGKYKTGFVLGLIGSVKGVVIFILVFYLGVWNLFFLSFFTGLGIDSFGFDFFGVGGMITKLILALFCSLVAFILGFVGMAKLHRGTKKGGVLLIVAGSLGVLCILFNAWYVLFSSILLLIGGIMAVAKKTIISTW